MTWLESSLRWYAVLVVCTWAFAPAVRWLCVAVADRGVTVTRPIALLAALYPAWLLGSVQLAPFTTALVVSPVLVAGAVGWTAMARRSGLDRGWLWAMATAELASLALFGAYLWLRGYTPQILGTEKPMDMAFLASSTRTYAIPPPDPWFAGEPINYYYLGYLLHGTIGRVAGVLPEIGFNMALATTFSMTTVTAFGVAWNVARSRLPLRLAALAGLLTAFFLAIAGNLYALVRLAQGARETVDAWWWDSATGIGWRASRVVCDGPRTGNLCEFPSIQTINEFPFFSFLLGDLHPHLMALPYTLVVIGLSWNLASRTSESVENSSGRWPVRLIITGAVSGSLLALNTWDFPIAFLVVALGLWAGLGFAFLAWKSALALAIAAVIPWLPFIAVYDPPAAYASALPAWLSGLPVVPEVFSTVALHLGEKTSIEEYLTVFGAPYAVGLVLLAAGMGELASTGQGEARRTLAITSVGLILAAALLAAPLLALCGIPLAAAIVQLRRDPTPAPRTFALAAFGLAWLLSILVEIFYVRDAFDSRMNTLFKFYFQTWTLYAVAVGVAFAWLWVRTERHALKRGLLTVAGATFVLAGLAYPLLATYQWTEKFAVWQGLDGLAYGELSDPDDTAAIRWLAAHALPGDVLLEAAGCSYRPFSRLPFNRMATFTGVPAIIGWGDNHQRQWRAGQPDRLEEIVRRQDDVAAMFGDSSSPLFETYGVRWFVIGEYELGNWKAECGTAGPYPGIAQSGHPGANWVEAFRSGETRIYRRAES